MKKILLLICLTLGAMTMNAQEVSSEQWSLITKKTADWCPNCGQWGWTFKNNILEDQKDKPVVFWMAHYSGDLQTETAKAIINNIPSSGQPIFYINNDNMNVFSSNIAAKRDEFNVLLDGLASFEAFGGVGSTASFDGEKITNMAKAKFFVDLEGGDYWLASYLVDDELVAYQASQGNNAVHENILLHSFNGSNYFGMNIQNGAVAADQEFIVEGELDFSGQSDIPDYTVGYSVVTILWSKVGGQYTPFNLNKQPVTGLVSTNDVLENVSVTAFHLGAGQTDLTINSDININNATITLFDINGRTVASKNNVSIIEGANQVMLDSQELSLGTYFVNIQSEAGNKSLKVSVR